MEKVQLWRCPKCGRHYTMATNRTWCVGADCTKALTEGGEFVSLDEVVAIVEAAAEGFEREQAVERAEEDFRAANFAFQKARAMKDLAAQLKGQA